MNLGMTEILLILGIVLLLFGPSKLPGLGKSMGEAIRGFKKGLSEPSDEKPAQVVREENSRLHGSAETSDSTKESAPEKNKRS